MYRVLPYQDYGQCCGFKKSSRLLRRQALLVAESPRWWHNIWWHNRTTLKISGLCCSMTSPPFTVGTVPEDTGVDPFGPFSCPVHLPPLPPQLQIRHHTLHPSCPRPPSTSVALHPKLQGHHSACFIFAPQFVSRHCRMTATLKGYFNGMVLLLTVLLFQKCILFSHLRYEIPIIGFLTS